VSDRYELRSVLGSGGMGTVWEAWDRRLGRPVALKVLRDHLPPSAAARLEREARAAARITDPRVVTVLDLERTPDGTPYLVLERHEGGTLADELRGGALPPDRLDRLVDDLLGALSAAHACGVLHRDVKPANVLASPGGFRVTDFGLASLDDDQTIDADLLGTLVYVAPERLDGARGSTRSDVFSAAVVLYEAATGVQPFRGDDAAASAARLRRGEAAPLPHHLPAGFRSAITRALSPDPERRPADAAELLAAIRTPAPPADLTVPLDATALLPALGREPAAPTAGEPTAAASVFVPAAEAEPAPAGVPSPAAAPTPASGVPAVPAPAPRPVRRREPAPPLRARLVPAVRLARRRPEIAVAVVGALLLLLLLLAEAVAPDGGDAPAPAAEQPAVTQPADLDGVLDRIEELGR